MNRPSQPLALTIEGCERLAQELDRLEAADRLLKLMEMDARQDAIRSGDVGACYHRCGAQVLEVLAHRSKDVYRLWDRFDEPWPELRPEPTTLSREQALQTLYEERS